MTLLEALLSLPAPTRPEPCDISPADPATEALRLLQRLKCYTLPCGRMPAARILVQKLEPLLAMPDFDPGQGLTALRECESALIALGGRPDPALAGAIGMVRQVFPDARLVGVKEPQ